MRRVGHRGVEVGSCCDTEAPDPEEMASSVWVCGMSIGEGVPCYNT
jgi:hypothetical protein